MSTTEDQRREIALAVTCPVCEASPTHECTNKATQNIRPKYRPHYLRYELAMSEAKKAKEGSQKLLLSLSQMAPPNSRDPRAYRLAVEDEDGNQRLDIELDEHQFCLLMGGHVVKVEGEVTR